LKKKILVVEDNEAIVEAYKFFIPSYFPGREVVVIDNLEAALKYALANFPEFEFVMLDGQIIGGLSYPIAVQLRAAGYKGPIILVTGRQMKEVVPDPEARWAFNGCYEKPLKFGAFAKEMDDNWLGEC
jgi:DNA-binding response OmpR family regulator